MQSVIVNVDNKSDLELLINLFKKFGFTSKILSTKEQKILLAEKFVHLQGIKNSNISEKEIKEEVRKVRTEKHANKK